MTPVFIHRPSRNTWCVLRRATGGRNIFLCLDWAPGNEPVHVLTQEPHNPCPACKVELLAGTPGAAVVVEPKEEPESLCTGMTARWCPQCGDCRCQGDGGDLNDPACPLHAPSSPHAEDETHVPVVARTATPRERPVAITDPIAAWDERDGTVCALSEDGP